MRRLLRTAVVLALLAVLVGLGQPWADMIVGAAAVAVVAVVAVRRTARY